MKITNVEVVICSFTYPKDFDFKFVHGKHVKRDTIIVKVFTDEGIIGLGEAHHQQNPEAIAAIIRGKLKPILIGADPYAVEVLWEKMFSETIFMSGAAMPAISGIDVALWDIIGKASKTPIYKLLGGGGVSRIRAYIGGLTFGFNKPDELVKEAMQYISRGFSALKIRGGRGEMDVEVISAIRAAVGDDIDIMIDANSAYSFSTALRLARKFEKYNVLFFEEPLWPGFHYTTPECAKLAAAVDIPIASGGNIYGRFHVKEIITSGGVDVIQPDVARSGGISDCRKIASIASAWHLLWSGHTMSGSTLSSVANLHMAAAIPPHISSLIEWDGLQVIAPSEELLTDPIKVEKGCLILPEKPGLGTEINEEVVSKHPFIPGGGWKSAQQTAVR